MENGKWKIKIKKKENKIKSSLLFTTLTTSTTSDIWLFLLEILLILYTDIDLESLYVFK